jgi:LacI family transcriptional regulator
MDKRNHSKAGHYVTELTLEDVARQAGVSRSTVSRVVNNHPDVREDVRKHVLEIIQNTGYHPHAAARALASQRSGTIGLVLPHSVSFFFTDPYFPHLVKGVAQGCNQYDYTLAFFLGGTKEDEKKIFPRVARSGLVDGVLVQAGHHGDQWIVGRLIDSNMPLVIIGRPFQGEGVSYIDIDNVKAAYNAVSYLVRLGYQRIGTIAGPANSTVGLDRKAGYLKALTESGLEIDQALITEGDFTEVGGYEAMTRLLSARPNAIFAASDIMAIGAMRAARDAGLKIPQDIAFIGFDDLPIAVLSDIKLTTVRQPVVQFGVKAVELLIDLLENGVNPPRRIIMDTELIVRESCGGAQRP